MGVARNWIRIGQRNCERFEADFGSKSRETRPLATAEGKTKALATTRRSLRIHRDTVDLLTPAFEEVPNFLAKALSFIIEMTVFVSVTRASFGTRVSSPR